MNISIALATYNGEKYIEDQIISVMNQVRLPDEIVICDDCSKDRTILILKKLFNDYHFDHYRIIENSVNKGAAFSFKEAIEACTGDVILFCDQDDYWYNNKINEIELAFEKYPQAMFIVSNADIIDENGASLHYTLWSQRKFTEKWQKQFESHKQFDVFMKRNIFTGMTTAIRKELVLFSQESDALLIHDAWYIPIALLHGYEGVLINKCLTGYRQHSQQQYGARKKNYIKYSTNSNLLRDDNFKSISTQLKILSHLYQYVIKHNISNEPVRKLRMKINHFENRKHISKLPKIKRIIPVLNDVCTAGYVRFSSLKNAVVDLLY